MPIASWFLVLRHPKILVDRSERARKIVGEQFLLVKQAGVLELFHVGQIAQSVEAEMCQKSFRRYVGVGRTGFWAARAGGDEACAAQVSDQVARNLAAEERRKLRTGDRLVIRHRHQHQRLRLRKVNGPFAYARGGANGIGESGPGPV